MIDDTVLDGRVVLPTGASGGIGGALGYLTNQVLGLDGGMHPR